MAANYVHNLITIHPLACKLQYTGGYTQQTESPLYYAQSRNSDDTVFVQCIGTMRVLFALNDWVTK